MPIFMILIILVLLSSIYIFINKKSYKIYRRPLLEQPQIFFIIMSIVSGTFYLKLSNFGENITLLTNSLLGLTLLLLIISIVLGFNNKGFVIGILGALYAIIFTILGTFIAYGIGKTIIFVAPGVVVIWILFQIFKKK